VPNWRGEEQNWNSQIISSEQSLAYELLSLLLHKWLNLNLVILKEFTHLNGRIGSGSQFWHLLPTYGSCPTNNFIPTYSPVCQGTHTPLGLHSASRSSLWLNGWHNLSPQTLAVFFVTGKILPKKHSYFSSFTKFLWKKTLEPSDPGVNKSGKIHKTCVLSAFGSHHLLADHEQANKRLQLSKALEAVLMFNIHQAHSLLLTWPSDWVIDNHRQWKCNLWVTYYDSWVFVE